MSRSGRPVLLCLFAAAASLAACSPNPVEEAETKMEEEAVGVHFLVLAEGAAEGKGGCMLLVADGTSVGGAETRNPIAPDGYRREFSMRDGKASFRYFIRPKPSQEAAQPQGELALEIELQQGGFHVGDALLEHFATRDGTEQAAYVWGESGCIEHHEAVPAWVGQRVTTRRP